MSKRRLEGPLWELAPWHYPAKLMLMMPASMLFIGGALLYLILLGLHPMVVGVDPTALG